MPAPTPTSLNPVPCADIAQLIGAQMHGLDGSADLMVRGVSLDSRTVAPGDMYAALPGATAHGAAYAAEALAAGAVAVLTDPKGAGILDAAGLRPPTLLTPEPRAVLGAVAARIYGTGRSGALTTIAVTGTNGKTTTAYLIEGALRALGRTTGLMGTVEIRIGQERVESARTTPEAPEVHRLLAAMSEHGVDTCVMEVSSHALALHRVDGVRYDVALFTNLSQDHLDFHADMADYFTAKAQLFTPAHARQGLVCVDDEWGQRLAAQASIPIRTLSSAGGHADWMIEPDATPGSFTLIGSVDAKPVRLQLTSSLLGNFNITNTAMAAVTLLLLGAAVGEVELAVNRPARVPGRMELVSTPLDDITAVVDYAHTPKAIEAALGALRPGATGPMIIVLGAGGERDRGKRVQMGTAAARGADVVIVTDDNPRREDSADIRAAVIRGVREAAAAELFEIGDRRQAIQHAVRIARHAVQSGARPVVAVVGKGHERGQDIAGTVHPFDDRDELRAALATGGS